MNKPKNHPLLEYLAFLKEQPKGFIYLDKQSENKITQEPKEDNTDKNLALDKLKQNFQNCTNCPLSTMGRTQVVFWDGTPYTPLMFIGEGPGRDEDTQGLPFVGRAGQLLNKIIQAMGLERQKVFISNVVKCRPPNNRTPLPNESDICKKLLLLKEIEIIKPKIICILGSTALTALLGPEAKISKMRGIFTTFNNIPVMPTYHPAYLLRNPDEKKNVWEDMKKVIEKLKELGAL